MQTNNFAVGSTNFNRGSHNGKWHKLQQNDNFFRILPPMFSLAADGRYSQYWAFHSGFKNSQGKVQMFKCIETKEPKTKLIKQHCPVCDLVANLDAHYKRLQEAHKAGQATEDQVKKFWNEQIFPIKAQKVFFVNAINQQGEVGVLSLPYKAHQALDAALKSCAERNGIDPTGIEGAWVNIKKVQPFPGSPQVSYGAEIVFEPTGDGSFQIKRHTITTDLLQNTIKNGARDLKTLFREISAQDMAQLASVQPEHRPALVDRIFGKPEANVEQSPLAVQVPGTQATLVGRVENQANGGYTVVMPTQPPPTAQMPGVSFVGQASVAPPPAAPIVNPSTAGFVQQATMVPPPVAPQVAPMNQQPVATAAHLGAVPGGTPGFVTQPVAGISDDDFRNIFGQ